MTVTQKYNGNPRRRYNLQNKVKLRFSGDQEHSRAIMLNVAQEVLINLVVFGMCKIQ